MKMWNQQRPELSESRLLEMKTLEGPVNVSLW